MLRALSTRRSRRGYERMVADESTLCLLEGNLKRSKTLPSKLATSFDLSAKLPASEVGFPHDFKVKPAPRKPSKNTTHPIFSLFDYRRKKKTTAKPEFTRYLQYLKEGGMWDVNKNVPVMYYK